MRILIYNWKDIKNHLVGGAEIITFEYARRLVKDGHQVQWFSRTQPGLTPHEIIDGVEIIRQGNSLTVYLRGWWFYRQLKTKPDLVIDMLNTIAWQTPLYAKRQSKVVQYINQLAKEVWHYELPWYFAIIGRLLEPLQLISYHRTAVVTYAASTKQDLIKWGYQAAKIKLFELGLDHHRYQPGPKSSDPLIIQVSRLVRMKRPDLTIRAFAAIANEFPKAKLIIVGQGPFRQALIKLIKELKLTNQVEMPEKDLYYFSHSPRDQKVALMQAAWFQVHPSVKEGWGMVITEAAACGTPTIGTAVTGQVDAIKDRVSGWLVSANPSIDELAAAMRQLLTDSKLRQQLSRGAIELAANYDWEKSYRSFVTALSAASGLKLRTRR